MSRENVCVALTHVALKGMHIYARDTHDAYLQASSSEKHYFVCGPKLGLDREEKHSVIVRALHGGKSSGVDYWRRIHSAMEEMRFLS